MAVIEYVGSLSLAGVSRGHYLCDVKDAKSNLWYRTNDERYPIQLEVTDVSKNAYVVLYKRTDEEEI